MRIEGIVPCDIVLGAYDAALRSRLGLVVGRGFDLYVVHSADCHGVDVAVVSPDREITPPARAEVPEMDCVGDRAGVEVVVVCIGLGILSRNHDVCAVLRSEFPYLLLISVCPAPTFPELVTRIVCRGEIVLFSVLHPCCQSLLYVLRHEELDCRPCGGSGFIGHFLKSCLVRTIVIEFREGLIRPFPFVGIVIKGPARGKPEPGGNIVYGIRRRPE